MKITSLLAILTVLMLTACLPSNPAATDGKLQVMATTSIVADVTANIGGEYVHVSTLLPLGSDPHSFNPTPQDAARLADADLLIISGAGLEEFLAPLLKSTGTQGTVVDASAGIQLLAFADPGHANSGGDPHTWMDPNNVMQWADNIATGLSQADQDPTHADAYRKNADAYIQKLKDLDVWVNQQVSQIPEKYRKLVTDHLVFSYFANRYGFIQVGAIIPGFSTLAEPSAQELAAIEDAIQKLDTRVIFVGQNVNTNLEQRVAEDTGAKLVFIYHASLSESSGPAATYLDFIRYNVTQMVNALK
jgi:manganese/iron transport system substrate-binding protein